LLLQRRVLSTQCDGVGGGAAQNGTQGSDIAALSILVIAVFSTATATAAVTVAATIAAISAIIRSSSSSDSRTATVAVNTVSSSGDSSSSDSRAVIVAVNTVSSSGDRSSRVLQIFVQLNAF
jgi:hypothetical protein